MGRVTWGQEEKGGGGTYVLVLHPQTGARAVNYKVSPLLPDVP